MFLHDLRALVLLASLLLASATAFAQGTAFTYQGKLADNGNPANGQYDFQFKLFDTQTVGTGAQQGSMFPVSNVTVTNGIFTVQIDFGACPTCFNGAARFLEIAVRPTGGGTFTILGPRQPFTANPYAMRSSTAATADGLSVACVNCVTSSQIASVSGNAVTGSIPVASVPAGSANYIQNTTSPQAASNFNISGNGTANILNATMHYSLAGLRVFTVNGAFNDFFGTVFTASNTFAGDGAGVNTTPSGTLNNATGKLNSFYGAGAGQANTTGGSNAFFGTQAGQLNTTGGSNAFFGNGAGARNTSGSHNAFFGNLAGESNTTGDINVFFGDAAGHDNTTGRQNSFFGSQTGFRNTTGNRNSFFGQSAGSNNTIGMQNTFIGIFADFNTSSSTGDNNTLLGYATNVNSGVNNGTAIGANASVTQSNSLVLGAITGVNSATADTKVGIGTTAPDALLDVQRDGGAIPQAWFTAYGAPNEILGRASDGTRASPTATLNGTTLLSLGATAHNGNGFVTVPRASIVMDAAQAWAPSATGTQMRFRTTANDTTGILTRMIITNDGNVGIGTLTPADLLQVTGDIRVGTGTTGCVKDSDGTVIAGACSSDTRLKRGITPFPHLLEKLVQLQPVHFYWRSAEFPDRHLGAAQSFGLVAQEVEKVLPELVREDALGFKTVNYSKLPLLTLQAIKELKAENDALKENLQKVEQQTAQIKTQATSIQDLQEQIKQQQLVISSLIKLVCADHPNAEICK